MEVLDQKMQQILSNYFDDTLHSHLLEQMETELLAGGEWLYREGDEADSLYFLVRGRLQSWLATTENTAGKLVDEFVPGDCIGELSLISGEPRSNSIKAIRDSLLIRINHDTFHELAKSYPEMAFKIVSNLSKVLHRRSKKTNASTMKTIGILPLAENAKIEQFSTEFMQQLNSEAAVIMVAPEYFAELGAPITELTPDEELPQALENWLSDLEDHYDYVLFIGNAQRNSWTDFIERQSDIVLIVADPNFKRHELDWEKLPESCKGKDDGRHALILLHDEISNIRNTHQWLDGHKYDFHLHIHSGKQAEIQRAVRIITGKGIGLVLGGGAARGLAALGVYKALCEANIPIDWVGGTSIGSIMAGTIATGWSPETAISNAHKAFKLGKPFNDMTLPIVSLLGGKRMKRLLDLHLDYQIEDLPIPYFCVSTNLAVGTKNIHERGSLVHAVRASAALPGIFPPVVVNEELAIDGAILDNLPVDVMREKHVGTIIAVEFSATNSMRVPFLEIPSPWRVMLGKVFPFINRHKVPKFISIIMKSTETATLEQVRDNARKADLLISPDIKHFGMTEVQSFDEIVQIGYDDAIAQLKNWSIEKST